MALCRKLDDRPLWGADALDVRIQLWRSLRAIAVSSGAIEILPDHLADADRVLTGPAHHLEARRGSSSRFRLAQSVANDTASGLLASH